MSLSVDGIGLVAFFACWFAGVPLAGTPATSPARVHARTPSRIVSDILKKDFSRAWVTEEGVSRRYSLVRVEANPYQNSTDGRIRILLRITVDRETGELHEIQGEYAKNEAELINQRRPPDTITAEKAIGIVADNLRRDGFKPALPPSRVDIDLVAGQYYIIRLPSRMPQAPRKIGDLSPDYFMHVLVDARTGKILEERMDAA